MKTRTTLLSVLALVAIALAAIAGCNKQTTAPTPAPPSSCPPATTAVASAAPVLDQVLLAYLSQASLAHHDADRAENEPAKDDKAKRAAKEKAAAALQKFIDAPMPPGPPSPEAREVLADTRARLAEIRSDLGEFDAAAKDLDQGLVHAKEPSYYRGRLFEVRGLVEDRREKVLRAKGDLEGAKKAHDEAVKASEMANEIQRDVVAKAIARQKQLQGGPAAPASATP